MTAYSDNDLIARLRNGDEDAFKTLFWKFHSPVYHNVRRILGDNSAAEDIAQEVFISLWQHRKQMNPSGDVKGWLFRVSYNKSVDCLKALKRKELLEQEFAYWSAFEDNHQAREAKSLFLEKAMAELSPRQKRVFELCRIDSKTYRDAAKELNISRHTVKEYLAEATRSVKNSMMLHFGEGLTSIVLLLTLLFRK